MSEVQLPKTNKKDAGYVLAATGPMGRFAEFVSDLSSPILVKEVRQAFSGRIFFIVFHVYLLSLVGTILVTLASPSSSAEIGRILSIAIFEVAAVPLLVIVPLVSFRSLAVEYDSGTIQLVSITSLNANRIITGKLGSSLLQVVIFLSATLPCVVFCSLFQGIDMFSVGWLALFMAVASIVLCSLGILLASFSSNRIVLAVLNLLFFAGLIFFCVMIMSSFVPWFSITWNSAPIDLDVMMIVGVSYALGLANFCRIAAISCITFPSENRTSRIRIGVLGLVFLYLWGLVWLASKYNPNNGLPGFILAGIGGAALLQYFLVPANVVLACLGACCAIENKQISNRVRRELWSDRWLRPVLIFLRPGPGKGYLFYLMLILCFNLSCAVAWNVFLDAGNRTWDPVNWFRLSPGALLLLGIGMVNTAYAYLFMTLSYFVNRVLKRMNGGLNAIVAVLGFVLVFFTVVASAVGLASLVQNRDWHFVEPGYLEALVWGQFPKHDWYFSFMQVQYRSTITAAELEMLYKQPVQFGVSVCIPVVILVTIGCWMSVGELYQGSKEEKALLQ